MGMKHGILTEILQFAVINNASDVHFSSNEQPMLRIKGEFKKVDIPPLEDDTLREELMSLLNEEQRRQFNEYHEVDLAITMEDIGRFRINIYEHFRGIAGAFRIFPNTIRSLDDLMLPKVVRQMVNKPKGLILVTGPTGSGKSTTLAAMVNEVNANRRLHIITIEDPAEYIHTPLQGIIHQRELGFHTKSFSRALMNCLREDPDVILVGEMREIETVTLALHAAETGHLVLSTLHTNTAAESVDRIVDIFPAEKQQQIRVMLANTLVGILAQRLVPMAFKNDRIALVEILVATPAIRNLIREGKSYQIPSAIQTGADVGMQTFERSFEKLRKNNLISPQLKLSDFV
ncbi:MAG: type IV pilus twitching motility protein PilT [Calditrichia bacterium]